MVIAATDSKGIQTSSQDAVENAFRALAQKFYYEGGDSNLTGKTLIASGLTSSSLSRFMGDMTFDTAQDGNFFGCVGRNCNGQVNRAVMAVKSICLKIHFDL